MKRMLRAMMTGGAMLVMLLSSTSAWAQLNRGSVTYSNDIYQNGNLLYVTVSANTMREIALCRVNPVG